MSIREAISRARILNSNTVLEKVPQPENKRLVLSMPYDPRLPSISSILKQRHRALLYNDVEARQYMLEPPLVMYTRTKNLRDILFRAKVPRRIQRGGNRTRPHGFYKCQKRTNCVLCLHSSNSTPFVCPITGNTAQINQHIMCQYNILHEGYMKV